MRNKDRYPRKLALITHSDGGGDMPMRSELSVCAAGPRKETSASREVWEWTVATLKNPEFQMVAVFCAVGLWLTFYFMARFPDFGEAGPTILLP